MTKKTRKTKKTKEADNAEHAGLPIAQEDTEDEEADQEAAICVSDQTNEEADQVPEAAGSSSNLRERWASDDCL